MLHVFRPIAFEMANPTPEYASQQAGAGTRLSNFRQRQHKHHTLLAWSITTTRSTFRSTTVTQHVYYPNLINGGVVGMAPGKSLS